MKASTARTVKTFAGLAVLGGLAIWAARALLPKVPGWIDKLTGGQAATRTPDTSNWSEGDRAVLEEVSRAVDYGVGKTGIDAILATLAIQTVQKARTDVAMYGPEGANSYVETRLTKLGLM